VTTTITTTTTIVRNKNKDATGVSKLNWRGDWYLGAKFTNDSNFFAREVGPGSCVL